MKPENLKNKSTNDKRRRSVTSEKKENTDSRYDYLMSLNTAWLATQNSTNDFIRSVN